MQIDGYHSVTSMGTFCPDPNNKFVLNNGVVIPLGEFIKNPELNNSSSGSTSIPEYIVYDTNQIRIRYIIQIKMN